MSKKHQAPKDGELFDVLLIEALLSQFLFFFLHFLNNLAKKIDILTELGQLMLNTIWIETLLILCVGQARRFILVHQLSHSFFNMETKTSLAVILVEVTTLELLLTLLESC